MTSETDYEWDGRCEALVNRARENHTMIRRARDRTSAGFWTKSFSQHPQIEAFQLNFVSLSALWN